MKQTLLATTPPITSFVMDLLAPFKHLIDNYDLGDMLKETARLYYNNNSINVNPFGSIFEAVVLAATLVALLSYLIEVKVEKSDDYGLETRSDAEYQPYIHKLQRQVRTNENELTILCIICINTELTIICTTCINRSPSWRRWQISRRFWTSVESTLLIIIKAFLESATPLRKLRCQNDS